MKCKYLLFLFLLFSTPLFSEPPKIGMTRIFSDHKDYQPEFYQKLENSIMSLISDLPGDDFSALNIYEKTSSIENLG